MRRAVLGRDLARRAGLAGVAPLALLLFFAGLAAALTAAVKPELAKTAAVGLGALVMTIAFFMSMKR